MNTPLPTVSSEGGPILVGDYERILKWRGVENGGTDYDIACTKVSASNLNTIDDRLLVWDFGGPGTGDILFRDDVITFIRTWANEELNNDDLLRLIDEAVFQPTEVRLAIPSGKMVFLWAPEDGASIKSVAGDSGVPIGDFSMGGTVHFQTIKSGTFEVHSAHGEREQDEIEYTVIRLTHLS